MQPADPAVAGRVAPRWNASAVAVACAAVIVGVVAWVGGPKLGAPWILGDEHMFIAGNPDVTGAGRDDPLPARVLAIFGKVHGDLYQPVPIASYAVEWWLWGEGRVAGIRRTDVLVHALNALLLFAVAAAVFRRATQGTDATGRVLLSASLAMVWALHPALAACFAADMGRTHMLGATFLLSAALTQLSARGALGAWRLAVVVACVTLAMMCKPTPLWFVVVAAIEALRGGWREALRSPVAILAAVACLGFATLNVVTTQRSGIFEETQAALFGGPVERALLALAVLVEHLFAPLDLATWYPPDPQTGWAYWRVWVGLVVAAAIIAGAVLCIRRRAMNDAALGFLWFAAALAPLLGIVGARSAVTQDRYLYLPLAGLLIAVGALVLRRFAASPALYAAAACSGVVALAAGHAARGYVVDCRDVQLRADRIVKRAIGDPRASEFAAVVSNYILANQVDPRDAESIESCRAAFLGWLVRAANEAEQSPRYFRDKTDRAAFHRRLSFQFLGAGSSISLGDADLRRSALRASLDQALRAADFEPDAPFTLTRLAHAYRALEQWEDALKAYLRLEQNLPPNAEFRALRLTEFGDLLLMFDRPTVAMPRYQAAIATGAAPVRARVGMARCEVLVGKGEEGFTLASMVLVGDPTNVDAMIVVAMYHLRSHHFAEAESAYRLILSYAPAHYEALRGLHEVVAQDGRWADALAAWDQAQRASPNAVFEAFGAWTAACAGDESARGRVDALLARDANHVFGCLSEMLFALRGGDAGAAVDWIERAAKGSPLPEAREFGRAEVTLRLLASRGLVGAESAIARGVLLRVMGDVAGAREVLGGFVRDNSGSRWEARASGILGALPESVPKP